MSIDFLYLLAWIGVTWVAGAATIGDPGPLGLGAFARGLWPADNPNAWWVFPSITLVGALLVLAYVGCLWNAIVGGHRMGPDGILRDGAGYPIWRLGPFTGRRR